MSWILAYQSIPQRVAESMLGLSENPIMMIANLCIGLCTPPVGTCLFVGCSVGQSSIAAVARAIWPFFLAMLAALLIITTWVATGV